MSTGLLGKLAVERYATSVSLPGTHGGRGLFTPTEGVLLSGVTVPLLPPLAAVAAPDSTHVTNDSAAGAKRS
eukprot:CAMPEP_0180329706 /NCGR_PEP_ID=MMETSP0988-20121125/40925_1 /TAXON_ID=697907 /ORGANISM="non described non described, Strain CCMP2293" /LENGTH=71 /DNA_ID=CAMNT_0022316869 /DNA_START=88 /DNA_END=300 /DNA_ORIENTATION=+